MTHEGRTNFQSQVLVILKIPQKPGKEFPRYSQISQVLLPTQHNRAHVAPIKLFPIFHPELNQGSSDSTGIPEQVRQILSLKTYKLFINFRFFLGWWRFLSQSTGEAMCRTNQFIPHGRFHEPGLRPSIFHYWCNVFYGMKERKKQGGRFKKAQLENKTLKFPFHRPCSLALTPFSTRVKGFFWLSGLAKLFLPGLSSEAKQSKKTGVRSSLMMLKEIKDKVVSKACN